MNKKEIDDLGINARDIREKIGVCEDELGVQLGDFDLLLRQIRELKIKNERMVDVSRLSSDDIDLVNKLIGRLESENCTVDMMECLKNE